nr:penicillin-binding protein activator [candidate division Zixibacteria bacterium]
MNFVRLFIGIAFLLGSVLNVTALADDTQIQFGRAYGLLNEGNYAEAYAIFSDLVRSYPDHRDMAAFLFFRGKAGYYLESYDHAIYDFKRLIKDYPNSVYTPYAELFIGNAHYRMGHPQVAISGYLEAYRLSKDAGLDGLLIESIEAALGSTGAVDPAVIRNLNLSPDRQCPLLIAAARGLMKRGNFQSVRSLLSPCSTPEAVQLLAEAERLMKTDTEIGVVLPLSGDFQKFGEQILDGIKLKAEQFSAETGIRIRPAMYDTRGDNVEAARIVKKLASMGTAAAIGPLTSEATAIASAVLACGDMPLIIPAATQGGLTELSETSFQLQPNLDLQGIMMADLAVHRFGADTAAIITATTPENLRMARAFLKRFEANGGKVIGVEYFRSRDTDFGPYIRDLKSLILDDLLDSIIFINETGDTIEAEEVPVRLDCLYIPANGSQLRMLLPQINFYNLQTVYLGGDGWGSSTVYDLGEAVTKQCYFTSGIINDNSGPRAEQFTIDFDRRFGHQPGRLEALGYDAMALICEALRAGYYSRSEIAGFLSGIENFEGVAGPVTFGPNRENVDLPVYTIENRAPRRVEIDIPKTE